MSAGQLIVEAFSDMVLVATTQVRSALLVYAPDAVNLLKSTQVAHRASTQLFHLYGLVPPAYPSSLILDLQNAWKPYDWALPRLTLKFRVRCISSRK